MEMNSPLMKAILASSKYHHGFEGHQKMPLRDRPEVPLHSNGSENDIRCQVTRRKVSAGTRSDLGRDAFLGLAKTCAKQGVAFWDYLGSRLGVPNAVAVPALPDLVRCRGQPA
jgi:hypothetical protein